MPKSPFVPSARQLRALRGWLGLSQQEFADGASVSVSALIDYERQRRQSSPDVLEAIARHVQRLKITVKGSALVLGE